MYRNLFLLLFCLIIINGCTKKEGSLGNKKIEQEINVPVKTQVIKRGTIKKIISLSGEIHGYNEVKVYSKVPGRLSKRIKYEGDEVKKDDIIAFIERDEEGLKFSEAEIKSPIDGVITIYFIGMAESVSPMQPIASIATIDKLKVETYVSEEDISKVKKGQKADIFTDTYPDKIFTGVVKEISAALHPVVRKLKIEIELDNTEHLLKPGMYVKIELITNYYSNILTVPKTAVLNDNELFIIENGYAKKVNVVCGVSDDNNIEIKSGVKEGQQVIIEGNYGLSDNTPVIIKN